MRKLICLFGCLFICACGGSKPEDLARAGLREGDTIPLRNIAKNSRCLVDNSIEVKEDLNQDGAVDVRKLYKQEGDGKILICRESDLNYDGTLDLYQFHDEKGEMKRDEVDLDFDGRIDVVSHWTKGKIFKQELDQNSDGFVDTIRYLKDGEMIKIEGDMDQNGHLDYWEYFSDGHLQRIGYDVDGDGKADRWDRDKIAATQRKPAAQGDEKDEPDETGTNQGALEKSAETSTKVATDKNLPQSKTVIESDQTKQKKNK